MRCGYKSQRAQKMSLGYQHAEAIRILQACNGERPAERKMPVCALSNIRAA
jgi:hypothetical protein